MMDKNFSSFTLELFNYTKPFHKLPLSQRFYMEDINENDKNKTLN